MCVCVCWGWGWACGGWGLGFCCTAKGETREHLPVASDVCDVCIRGGNRGSGSGKRMEQTSGTESGGGGEGGRTLPR